MRNQDKGLSRRTFLAGSALGVGALSAGLLAGCAPANTGNASPQAVEWSDEYDIVVVGFGAAGGGAAAEAAANGASVIVLEKMDEAQSGGSSTCFANQWFSLPAAWLVQSSLGKMPQETAAAREAMGYEAMDLMSSYGMQLLPSGYEIDGGSKKFYEIMSTNVKGTEGIVVQYESPVMGLVQNHETGEVLGVRVVRDDGETYIKANKGVVLCTGGYEANEDLVRSLHCPSIPMAQVGGPSHTGEGLFMCLEAGAEIENLCKGFDWSEFCFRKASEETGTGLYYRWYSVEEMNTGKPPEVYMHDSHILVDMNGQRFMDERTVVTHNKSQLAFTDFSGGMYDAERGYRHMPFFMVFDDAMMKSGPLGKFPQDATPWTWAYVHETYDWSDDNQAELEKGWILKADSLEELASKMVSNNYLTGEEVAMDPAGLAAQVEEYNAGCATGEDKYGRPVTSLNPIAQPPFYAIEMIPGSLYTICGPASDINSQVVRFDGELIPRLYCAGNIGQGLAITPMGVAACMGCGMAASRHAVSLDPWS